ncbi:hypothetical protein PIB30_016434 [Stylosanthes scabra]|uniref:Uncharacterized protein n=1 Tax=Stylosanthes scabra TaxID=79078 RepID=A0ABU6W5B7_9FABA|nr:hypothetical protein [Stylosanthes scabra]
MPQDLADKLDDVVGDYIWFVDNADNCVGVHITRQGNSISFSGEQIVTLRNQSAAHEKVRILIHYLTLGLFSAQVATEGFNVLPAFSDRLLYAAHVLPGGVIDHLEVYHGIIFDRIREVQRDEEHMGEILYHSIPSAVSSQNSVTGEDLEDDASSLAIWDSWDTDRLGNN